MTSAVIVCTRNRPADMERLLSVLPGQTIRPRLLVVDSSDDAETRTLVDAFAGSSSWPRVEYVHTMPGLTRQRMVGVRIVANDVEIVHFVDDDVVPEPDYFEAIERAFTEYPASLGVGGVDTDLPPHQPRWTGRLFGIDTSDEGRVLRSGHPVLVHSLAGTTEVDWLSGCSMSFRAGVFSDMSFDEALEGYSLGEDVDFTYRLSRRGPLVVTPQARLRHLQSARNRVDAERIAADDVVRRYRFVRRMQDSGMSSAAFWWSVFGEVLTLGVKSVLRRDAEAAVRRRGMIAGVRRVLGGER